MTLREQDVEKAEKIIAKLHRLEAVTTSSADFRFYNSEMKRLYPGLFIDASKLRESGLKSDLSTAVFLYETAYRVWFTSGTRKTVCHSELRETYLKLCRAMQDGTRARLILSKARLHTKWAAAAVRSYRGATDAVTLSELAEIEAARKVDLILAEQAVKTLMALAESVGSYASIEDFEDAQRAKKISFERQSADISEAISKVDQVLRSLPSSRLELLLYNARSSYQDGLFWWGKTHLVQARAISVNNLAAHDPLKAMGLTAGSVNNTVLGNWRRARRYTQEAEKAINVLKS